MRKGVLIITTNEIRVNSDSPYRKMKYEDILSSKRSGVGIYKFPILIQDHEFKPLSHNSKMLFTKSIHKFVRNMLSIRSTISSLDLNKRYYLYLVESRDEEQHYIIFCALYTKLLNFNNSFSKFSSLFSSLRRKDT